MCVRVVIVIEYVTIFPMVFYIPPYLIEYYTLVQNISTIVLWVGEAVSKSIDYNIIIDTSRKL